MITTRYEMLRRKSCDAGRMGRDVERGEWAGGRFLIGRHDCKQFSSRQVRCDDMGRRIAPASCMSRSPGMGREERRQYISIPTIAQPLTRVCPSRGMTFLPRSKARQGKVRNLTSGRNNRNSCVSIKERIESTASIFSYHKLCRC